MVKLRKVKMGEAFIKHGKIRTLRIILKENLFGRINLVD